MAHAAAPDDHVLAVRLAPPATSKAATGAFRDARGDMSQGARIHRVRVVTSGEQLRPPHFPRRTCASPGVHAQGSAG